MYKISNTIMIDGGSILGYHSRTCKYKKKKGEIDEKIVRIVYFMLNEIRHKINGWQYNDNNCTNMIAV